MEEVSSDREAHKREGGKGVDELWLERLNPKYDGLSPKEFAVILGGTDTKAQHEVMLYSDLRGNNGLARQIYDLLGEDGIRRVILAECINPYAPEWLQKVALECIRQGIGERLRELAQQK